MKKSTHCDPIKLHGENGAFLYDLLNKAFIATGHTQMTWRVRILFSSEGWRHLDNDIKLSMNRIEFNYISYIHHGTCEGTS